MEISLKHIGNREWRESWSHRDIAASMFIYQKFGENEIKHTYILVNKKKKNTHTHTQMLCFGHRGNTPIWCRMSKSRDQRLYKCICMVRRIYLCFFFLIKIKINYTTWGRIVHILKNTLNYRIEMSLLKYNNHCIWTISNTIGEWLYSLSSLRPSNVSLLVFCLFSYF